MKTNLNLTGRILVFLSFLLISLPCISQDETTIYLGTNGKLTTLKDAIYMQKVKTKSHKVSKVDTYQLKDSKWDKINAENYKKLNDSTWQIKGNGENVPAQTIRTYQKQADNTLYFKDKVDGMIVRSGYAQSIIPLLLHGQVTEYYPGDKTKSVSNYNNNELISNENWNDDGEKYIDNIFYSVDTYPGYNGNIKELHEHIMKGFKDSGMAISEISGSVIVGFVVMEDGTIEGIKIIKGLGKNINTVAYEAFNTLKDKWTPAKLNGQAVRYFQVFPINFIYKENYLEYAELRGAILHYNIY